MLIWAGLYNKIYIKRGFLNSLYNCIKTISSIHFRLLYYLPPINTASPVSDLFGLLVIVLKEKFFSRKTIKPTNMVSNSIFITASLTALYSILYLLN